MESTKSGIICVIGSANRDLYYKVKKLPQDDETIQATDHFMKNGGKGANQAVAAARLSKKSFFGGQVGNDDNGRELARELKEAGVDISCMKVLDGVTTGQAVICLSETGGTFIIIVGGANTSYLSFDTLPAEYAKAIDESSLLLLQKEIPLEINILSAKYAKKQNKIVALDCGGSDYTIPDELLGLLDFISPNSVEVMPLMGVKDESEVNTQSIREKLIAKYKNLDVLLKQGKRGCTIITSELEIPCPSVPMINGKILEDYKIIDPVGAGDCFTASFFVRYAEIIKSGEVDKTRIFKESMLFANASAFLCITKVGAMPSMPAREDVDKFIEKYELNSYLKA